MGKGSVAIQVGIFLLLGSILAFLAFRIVFEPFFTGTCATVSVESSKDAQKLQTYLSQLCEPGHNPSPFDKSGYGNLRLQLHDNVKEIKIVRTKPYDAAPPEETWLSIQLTHACSSKPRSFDTNCRHLECKLGKNAYDPECAQLSLQAPFTYTFKKVDPSTKAKDLFSAAISVTKIS